MAEAAGDRGDRTADAEDAGAGRKNSGAGRACHRSQRRGSSSGGRTDRAGFVQALFGGNAIATHDVESVLLGTSLGMALRNGSRWRAGIVITCRRSTRSGGRARCGRRWRAEFCAKGSCTSASRTCGGGAGGFGTRRRAASRRDYGYGGSAAADARGGEGRDDGARLRRCCTRLPRGICCRLRWK